MTEVMETLMEKFRGSERTQLVRRLASILHQICSGMAHLGDLNVSSWYKCKKARHFLGVCVYGYTAKFEKCASLTLLQILLLVVAVGIFCIN